MGASVYAAAPAPIAPPSAFGADFAGSDRNPSARAGTNIALVKYWGKRDAALNLPAAGSLSLTLQDLDTITSVDFPADDPYVKDPLGPILEEHGRSLRKMARMQGAVVETDLAARS